MMAEQGVKNARLHFAAHGNLAQDVATATVLRKLSAYYLQKCGYAPHRTLPVSQLLAGPVPARRGRLRLPLHS